VVVLAVPYEDAGQLVQEYGEGLSGKVVVDITNPVDW
jgi:predicted dinucleotide-binding enzyme